MHIDSEIFKTTKLFGEIPPGGTFIYGGSVYIKAMKKPDGAYTVAVRLHDGDVSASITPSTKVEPIELKVVPLRHR